jgi:hypothetical protein
MLLCLPLYSTSTYGSSNPPAMLIGFSKPLSLLCLAAPDRFLQSVIKNSRGISKSRNERGPSFFLYLPVQLTVVKDGQIEEKDLSIEQEIECARCHGVMTLCSEFDRLGYYCEECSFSLHLSH